MSKTLWGVAFVVAAVASVSSLSAAKYGMAGCGPGALIISENTMPMQVLAGTTNGIGNAYSGSQSFAISSGTSNCSDDEKAFNEKQQQIFVHVNLSGLQHEMAAGNGEKLTALSGLMGCPVEVRAEFRTVSRSSYQELSRSNKAVTAPQLLKALRENVAKDKMLAEACRV